MDQRRSNPPAEVSRSNYRLAISRGQPALHPQLPLRRGPLHQAARQRRTCASLRPRQLAMHDYVKTPAGMINATGWGHILHLARLREGERRVEDHPRPDRAADRGRALGRTTTDRLSSPGRGVRIFSAVARMRAFQCRTACARNRMICCARGMCLDGIRIIRAHSAGLSSSASQAAMRQRPRRQAAGQ